MFISLLYHTIVFSSSWSVHDSLLPQLELVVYEEVQHSPKTAHGALYWLCGSVCTGGRFLAPQFLVQLLANGVVLADLSLTGQVCAHV